LGDMFKEDLDVANRLIQSLGEPGPRQGDQTALKKALQAKFEENATVALLHEKAHGVLEQCLGAEEAARVVQCRVRACQEDGSYPRYVQVALQRKGMEGDWAQLEYTKALEWCVQYTSAIVGFIGGPYNQEATVQEWASDMVFMDYQQLKEQERHSDVQALQSEVMSLKTSIQELQDECRQQTKRADRADESRKNVEALVENLQVEVHLQHVRARMHGKDEGQMEAAGEGREDEELEHQSMRAENEGGEMEEGYEHEVDLIEDEYDEEEYVDSEEEYDPRDLGESVQKPEGDVGDLRDLLS